MPLDVGRVTHLAEQMHRSEDDSGTPIDSGFLLAADGAAGLEWVDPSTIGGLADPMTTRGDIIYRNASNATARLPVGAAGKILSSNGTDASWGNGPMTTQDDLIVGGASGTPTRLGKGSDGQILTVDSTTHHLVWATPSSGFSNPMTTKGDVIVGDTGGSPIRKAVGSDGDVLTADSASTGGIKWAAAGGGGGGGITQAFVGKNAQGASWETVTSFRQYCKQVTLANACLVTSIDMYIRQSNDNVEAIAATILTDNSGSPDELIAYSMSASGQLYLSVSGSMPGPGRWLYMPIGAWLPAGTYWICFMGSINRFDIAYDAGSDKIFSASQYLATGAYPSAWALSNSSRDYSIRANTIH